MVLLLTNMKELAVVGSVVRLVVDSKTKPLHCNFNTQSPDKLQFRFYCFTLKLLFDDLVDTDNATCESFHVIVVAKKAMV